MLTASTFMLFQSRKPHFITAATARHSRPAATTHTSIRQRTKEIAECGLRIRETPDLSIRNPQSSKGFNDHERHVVACAAPIRPIEHVRMDKLDQLFRAQVAPCTQ